MLSIRWWQVGPRLLTPGISHTLGVAAARSGLFWGRRFAAASTRKYLPCGGGRFFRTLATWCLRLFWSQGPSCRSRLPRSAQRLQNSRLCKAPCRPITEQWCKVEEGKKNHTRFISSWKSGWDADAAHLNLMTIGAHQLSCQTQLFCSNSWHMIPNYI